MAVMTKAEAKKFLELDDRMIDILNFLKAKSILDEETHRKILLGGYFRLIEYLAKKNMLKKKQADDALENGFDSLIKALAS